jgi:hypothetical protein
MKKYISLAILAASVGITSGTAQTITGFGSSEFTFDAFLTDFTTKNQSATALQVIGTDAQSVFGFFTDVTLADFTNLNLELTGTLVAANTGLIAIELGDADGDTARWEGSWSSFTANTPGTAVLTFASQTGTFNGTASLLLLSQNGLGTNAVNFTLDNLAAVSAVVVPEPSTYASLAGVAALGFVAYRRRRVAA